MEGFLGDTTVVNETPSEEFCPENEQEAEFRGYKQLLLVLQSTQVETGKSLLADIATRIFHGRKTELKSTISFNCAKSLLGRGEPVVIGGLKKQLSAFKIYIYY